MKTPPKNFYIGRAEIIANNDKLTDKARQSIYIARADNTINAYQSDWNDFCDWCEYHEVDSFPALPETIINYINDLADNAKANTVARRISALTENFDAAGLKDNPCRFPIVKNALRGIKRMKGTIQHGKMPILFDDIKEMLTYLEGNDLQQTRDKAILLIGFYGAMRRSELAGLDIEDLQFTRLGLLITLRKSKTDQYDQGQLIAIPYVQNKEVCAVTALKNWLTLSDISSGPVFRGFTRGHTIRKTRISDKTIALIVKHYAGLMGMDPKDYGAHSLRHGFATSAAQHHVEERQIMRQTRHKSQTIVRRYIDEADRLIDNPIFKITENK
ncbi:integrase [Megasphaera cerevisiae DSM 20462]|jgi:integrase|uniref:Integrase n=1 Tax=Megasphaera cerevisiae DSM 20462 TaxID=1122219 RepID=A0A0J6WPM7_9FIRM|nr:site-specific integrase [Megasphaera cerevisiae]KMO85365.1 integrase [Megasphaera cerevisiae DSM 20462]MCI1750053.1 site-specific integrase [Megasphaera cerevisiae]SJZ98363.1 Site-specific recombinase XerD [Megasphaera cerevisiae DSM 20462]